LEEDKRVSGSKRSSAKEESQKFKDGLSTTRSPVAKTNEEGK
jgi:hypothetical protein